MNYVYASRFGHVEALVKALNLNACKIEDGTEKVDGDYILFTYTDGKGIVPKAVEAFLKNNPGIKGVVASGDKERHADTFAVAADIIAKEYNVPSIAKVDGSGTEDDQKAILSKLS